MKVTLLTTLFVLNVYATVFSQFDFLEEVPDVEEEVLEEETNENNVIKDIEVYFLAHESDENTIDIFIPSLSQSLAFKKFPYHFHLNMIENLSFKENNHGFTISINKKQKEFLNNMLEHYNSSSVAILFRASSKTAKSLTLLHLPI